MGEVKNNNNVNKLIDEAMQALPPDLRKFINQEADGNMQAKLLTLKVLAYIEDSAKKNKNKNKFQVLTMVSHLQELYPEKNKSKIIELVAKEMNMKPRAVKKHIYGN